MATPPLQDCDAEATPESRAAIDGIRATHGRVHQHEARWPVALSSLMTWYTPRPGGRRSWASGSPRSLPTPSGRYRLPGLLTFFRRMLIDPARTRKLRLDDWEQTVVAAGNWRSIHGFDELFARLAARLQPDQIVAHGLRRADGRDQPVQQCAPGRTWTTTCTAIARKRNEHEQRRAVVSRPTWPARSP